MIGPVAVIVDPLGVNDAMFVVPAVLFKFIVSPFSVALVLLNVAYVVVAALFLSVNVSWLILPVAVLNTA